MPGVPAEGHDPLGVPAHFLRDGQRSAGENRLPQPVLPDFRHVRTGDYPGIRPSGLMPENRPEIQAIVVRRAIRHKILRPSWAVHFHWAKTRSKLDIDGGSGRQYPLPRLAFQRKLSGAAMGQYSQFLFARPSFLEGAARILDFGDTLSEYNRSPTEADADFNALYSDWLAVGDDLRNAVKRYEREQEQQRAQSSPRIDRRAQEA